ncbi:MAG: hypothetical protein ACREBS_01005 [Nitrososphaerales archaeon]
MSEWKEGKKEGKDMTSQSDSTKRAIQYEFLSFIRGKFVANLDWKRDDFEEFIETLIANMEVEFSGEMEPLAEEPKQ